MSDLVPPAWFSEEASLDFAYGYYEEDVIQELKKCKLTTRWDLRQNPYGVTRKSTGDRRLEALIRILDEFGLQRHVYQRTAHDAFTQACLAHIYGEEYETELERVCKEHDWDATGIRHQCIMTTPRRMG